MMKKVICNIVYYLMIVAVSISMTSGGIGIDNIRWWIVILGMCVAKTCGGIIEHKDER